MSKKKSSGVSIPGVLTTTVNLTLSVVRYSVRFLGRFFSNLFHDSAWIFHQAPTANTRIDAFYSRQFGNPPHVGLKIGVAILLSPLVITILIVWSALKAI